MDTIRILILAANPWDTKRLGLDEEFQRIQELWESSERRDDFELRYYPALRGEALQEKVLKFKPHLLHFSGHGENSGLVFADVTGDKPYEVSKDALAQLFKLCAPELQGVFLNACHSAKQADAIVEQVDYVVGMNTTVNDLAAISFSQGFYSAIFSQTQLNIEQAFEAGLSQMAIVQIAASEQKKPILQKRPKTFVPNFQHDVFISFVDEDAQWTQDLSEYLRKQLKQQLATADGFQLYSGNDFHQLPQSALLLIIASPEYCQHYAAQFEKIGSFAKQQPVFLVERKVCTPRPEVLKGFTPYKFWYYDDSEGMMSITGDAYVSKANDLVLAIAKRLIELKTAQQQQQRLVQQRSEQQESRAHENINGIDAFVFIHSAPEDLDLTTEIVPILKNHGIDYILPITRSPDMNSTDIRQDIESNIFNCDAVLILYEQTTPIWVREQLGTCRRLQRKRETPLKVIAVHKDKDQPDIDCHFNNLQVYICPPENIASYLQHFIKALA